MVTRVTSTMMVDSYNHNLNTNNKNMFDFQQKLATGRKITRLSEDPVNAVKAVTARARISDTEQYRKNLSDAKAWVTQSETALTELNSIIQRAYVLSIQAANDPLGDEERSDIGQEIKQLREQIVTLANTTLGDKFIFGGYTVSKSPFDFDPENGEMFYNGDSMLDDDIDLDSVSYEISFALDFDIALKAGDAFGVGENNIYKVFSDYIDLLDVASEKNADGYSLTHEEVAPYPDVFLELQRNLLTQISECGGRYNRIELMEERYANDEINYTQMQSDVEDLDMADAYNWFAMAQSVYRASLSVGAKILQPSLVDFMR